MLDKKIGSKPKGELVYVGPEFSSQLKSHHLAWKYNIYALQPQSSQTIYVDANSGNVILKLDLQMDTDYYRGTGAGRYSGNVEFSTHRFEEGFKLGGITGKFDTEVVTWNMNNAPYPSDEIITEFVDGDNLWNLNNPSHDEVAIDIQWGLEQSINYYADKFNRNSVDDNGMTIIGLAHLGNRYSNASWTGGWAQFGDGSNNNPFTSLGIVGHELTHAVTQFSAGLIYQGESGALNEAFSDMFGIAIEFNVGKDTPEDIWQLGNEIYQYGSMRSMSNPNDFNQPDTYGGMNWANPDDMATDNGGVHINSGIANFWFYLLTEGGEDVNDNGENYSVTGIGIEKAEKIAYKTLTEYLTPSSQFIEARIASLLATEDLYGIGSEEYIQVSNAWHAVGVGGPYSKKQINLVSYEGPTAQCGNLRGIVRFKST
ncbi:M4 family metallopeptidase [Galbibacter sp. PAP.153]|uniref:M4 family metallopeptidase n=1 Tax=Galbibacter sp. PAP.153 TaxID=3104623 RepID=UPI003009C9AC